MVTIKRLTPAHEQTYTGAEPDYCDGRWTKEGDECGNSSFEVAGYWMFDSENMKVGIFICDECLKKARTK